jgi:hypothetical protein
VSVTTLKRSNLSGYKSRTLLNASNAGPVVGISGTPFHKGSGQSVSGAGVITLCDGNPTIDGVLMTGFPNGSNDQGQAPFLRFNTSASITSGSISGLLLPTASDTISIPTRTTGPTTYATSTSGSFGSGGGSNDQTYTVASIGTATNICTSISYSTSHSNIDGNYPPTNLTWQWWLYVNSADTSNTNVQVWYAAHNTGSYNRYNCSSVAGLVLPYRGILKVRLRVDSDKQANMTAYATVATYG